MKHYKPRKNTPRKDLIPKLGLDGLPVRLDMFRKIHPRGTAFDYQEKWALDTSSFKLGVKARQIGITTTEAVDTFLECLLWKESERYPLPHVICFCSPSQRQSSRLMTYVQRCRHNFERLFGRKIQFRRERDDLLHFDNFCEIWSLPNNPRTIEGLDSSKGIIDEVGNFEGREDRDVYSAMMASLAAKGGGLTVFGKPRGRRGLFWDLYNPYGPFTGQFSVHKFDYTVRAANDPVYAKAVEEHRLRMSPVAFDENYNCAFVDEGVVVFPWEMLDKQTKDITTWTVTGNFSSQDPIYMGIDFGRKVNKSAVSVVEHTKDKTYLRFNHNVTGEFEKQKDEIIAIIKKFNPIKCFVDATGMGLPLAEELISIFGPKVEGITISNQVKEKMIIATRNLLESGTLLIPDIKELRDQLHGMEKEVLDSGRIKYTGKRSETDWLDDRAFSLFLACSQLGEGDFHMTIIDTNTQRRIDKQEAWKKGLDEFGHEL